MFQKVFYLFEVYRSCVQSKNKKTWKLKTTKQPRFKCIVRTRAPNGLSQAQPSPWAEAFFNRKLWAGPGRSSFLWVSMGRAHRVQEF